MLSLIQKNKSKSITWGLHYDFKLTYHLPLKFKIRVKVSITITIVLVSIYQTSQGSGM